MFTKHQTTNFFKVLEKTFWAIFEGMKDNLVFAKQVVIKVKLFTSL